MAGMDIHAEEAKTKPEYWTYKADGSFNHWYPFIAPANPGHPAWQEFYLDNVQRLLGEYKLDGLWLDSSWQDHQLNYKSQTGCYAENNCQLRA